MRPVGIVANPASGKDVRRLLTNAGTSTLEEKVGVVRRLLVGAFEAGARSFFVLPEPHGIVGRALVTLPFADELEVGAATHARHHDERDTVAAAGAMRAEGCAVVVVLGGDGTNRAVALGWPGAPVIPLSTGTNNAFPAATEATVAGAAAGHLATGLASTEGASTVAKVVRIAVEGEDDDLALVDAAVLREPPGERGSRKPFPPAQLAVAVLTRAEPTAAGISAVGSVLDPVSPDDDHGLVVHIAPPGAGRHGSVRAPLAPGTYAEVGIDGHRRLALGEEVTVEGPGLLAFDGDRRRVLHACQGATLWVERSGPRVIDVAAVLGADAARRHWRRD